jgi:hypothetical protein
MKLNLSNIKKIPKRQDVKSDDAFERDAKRRQRWLDDSDVVPVDDDTDVNTNPADEPDELRAMLNQDVEPDYLDLYCPPISSGSHICQDPVLVGKGWTMGRKRVVNKTR